MPPQILSDSDSDGDVIVAKPAAKASRKPQPVELSEDDEMVQADEEDEEVEAEPEEEEEYVVETIKDHKYEGKKLMLLVKWKGYEKKSDMTWEPEDNCEGAKEALEEYYESIGGRPTFTTSPAISSKRSRQSNGSTPVASATRTNKKPRTSIGSSLKKGSGSPPPKEDKWKPPTGSWESEIKAIDTIEKTDKGGLVCYVEWNNGRKSQHEIHTVYNKCPQRMLQFYEQHLVFKECGTL